MMFCKEKSTIKIARRETNFNFAPRSAGGCGRIWRPEVVSSRALFCPVPTAWPGAEEPKSPAAQETGSSRAARSGNYLRLGLKTDGNISVLTRSVFYFCPSVSVFVASRFHIYRSRNEVSPSVFEKSRFYMELTRIYSVFHPIFNLHKICLKINMYKNIPITKYAY